MYLHSGHYATYAIIPHKTIQVLHSETPELKFVSGNWTEQCFHVNLVQSEFKDVYPQQIILFNMN